MAKKIKREFIEWGLILAVFGTLYVTGWHTEVLGQIQRLVVASGIMQPDVLAEDEQPSADYSFTLIDQEGNRIPFEAFKGKTVFLNFWATWCAPCRAEMPDIHDLYEKTASDEVVFVLVSIDDDFEKAKRFVQQKGFEFPIYSLATRRPEVFSSNVVPSTYIISKTGNVVARRSGMAKYDTDEIRGLLVR